MPTYKNIRIKKKGGGTRIQRVQVLKSGKYKFVKNTARKTTKKASSKRKTKKKTSKGSRKRVANRKVSLAVVGGILGGVGRKSPRGPTLFESIAKGDWNGLMYDAREILAGVDVHGKLRLEWLVQTYGPMVIGGLIHRYVGGPKGLNLNQYLRGIPLISI